MYITSLFTLLNNEHGAFYLSWENAMQQHITICAQNMFIYFRVSILQWKVKNIQCRAEI